MTDDSSATHGAGQTSGPASGGTARAIATISRHPECWGLGIILVSFVVRLWFVASGQLDLVQDEAQYWDWSRRFQLSYYSKGPLIAWVIDFWTFLFGATELGVRMGAVVNATLAQIFMYFGLARLMRRPLLAVLALLVANTMPLFLACGVLMTTDNILMLCWLGGLFCLYALTNPTEPEGKTSLGALVLLGLCMALGNLAKYMMLALFAVAIFYYWLLGRHGLLRRGLAMKTLGVMTLGSFLGYVPILIWNAQHGWIGLRHVGTLAGVAGSAATRLIRLDTVPEFLAAQFGVATPWWMLLMLFAGWRALRFAWRGGTENCALPGSSSIQVPSTHIASGSDRLRQAALLACGFWPVWLGMFAWSFHTRIYANWPGMSYVAGIMLAAAGLERLLTGHGSRLARRFAPLWPALGLLLFLLVFAQNCLTLPPQLNPAMRLKGWSDLGHELGELARGLPNPGKVFYFGDNYDVTAELAFYVPGQPITFCADFGRRRSQYDLWPDPTGQTLAFPKNAQKTDLNDNKMGWDALYVSTRGRTPQELFTMFDKVTTIPYISTHRGQPGREFTIVLLRNFTGRWPHTDHARY